MKSDSTARGTPGWIPAWLAACVVGARRLTAKSQIFQVKVQLREVRPPVWPRLQVPGDMRMDELHVVVQVAMGWLDCHLHEFEVDGVRYGVPDDDWGFEGCVTKRG